MVRALLVGLVFLAAGCAHVETTQEKNYRAALNAWVGKDVNQAFEMMGPPTAVFKMPDGRAMYTWVALAERKNQYYGGRLAGHETHKFCRTVFTASVSGRVDAIRSEGQCGVGR